jgi:hypothetical protein
MNAFLWGNIFEVVSFNFKAGVLKLGDAILKGGRDGVSRSEYPRTVSSIFLW